MPTLLEFDFVTIVLISLSSIGVLSIYGRIAAARAARLADGSQMPKSVREALDSSPEFVKHGGEIRDASVLVCDLPEFQGLFEKLKNEEIVDKLNMYLREATKVISDSGGSIDNYDCQRIQAFWSDREARGSHALGACRGALRTVETIWRLNEEHYRPAGLGAFEIRVGIRSGPALVAIVGTNVKIGLSVIGPAAEQARRFEQLCLEFGVHILTSEETVRHANPEGEARVVFRPLAKLRLKGKLDKIVVYEVMAMAGEGYAQKLMYGGYKRWSVAETNALLSMYSAAILFYWSGAELAGDRAKEIDHYQRCHGMFQQIIARYPEDYPSMVYRQLCQQWIENKIPEGWDGVHVILR
ncbi:MAG: adenylate/guanylate cyclase domain-containing protein [Planctomycetes bacterium]|nr:adenylate/guanylate cyclase domain-containing protein [Planctomycetota bacterium]